MLMVGTHEIARVVNAYVHRRPGESLALAPLWQTLQQHAKTGTCAHRGSCPVVKVSPVVVDEHHRVLTLESVRGRLRLPEAGVPAGFDTLPELAINLARALGAWEVWVQPGCEDPIHLEPARADPEDGLRTRVAIRYLYRTHSETCRFAPGAPQRWTPLSEMDHTLADRVGTFLAEEVA
ncbi:hypothetical protein [Streptomyces sp. NPDC006134]|uniref:hypothetical protein n=1 Tax=Streptomyces sp. NPDC006134 TaxID=3154467 RepID=UPI003403EBF3